MSNPTVVNVVPVPNATDVVLGSSIVVTFSEAIDTDSFNNATFALTGPNISSIVTPDQLVEAQPAPSQGRGYILGTFGFSTKTFQLWSPFQNYHIGDQVADSNGNAQTATEAGMSGPYAPTWLTLVGETTVDNNVPAWQALQGQTFGSYILDPNGNLQKVTSSVAGTTGSQAPSWNRIVSGITFDGSVTWTNYGLFSPVVWANGGVANNGQTVATFIPSKPLRPGITYTVLVVGADSVLANSFVHNLAGNNLLSSYQWSFSTGTLNISTPPTQNPLLTPKTTLSPEQIQVIPRSPVGVSDPSVFNISVVDIIFPHPIDINTFDPTQLLVGVEPIMNDPDVALPAGASASYIIQGNKLIVTVSGV